MSVPSFSRESSFPLINYSIPCSHGRIVTPTLSDFIPSNLAVEVFNPLEVEEISLAVQSAENAAKSLKEAYQKFKKLNSKDPNRPLYFKACYYYAFKFFESLNPSKISETYKQEFSKIFDLLGLKEEEIKNYRYIFRHMLYEIKEENLHNLYRDFSSNIPNRFNQLHKKLKNKKLWTLQAVNLLKNIVSSLEPEAICKIFFDEINFLRVLVESAQIKENEPLPNDLDCLAAIKAGIHNMGQCLRDLVQTGVSIGKINSYEPLKKIIEMSNRVAHDTGRLVDYHEIKLHSISYVLNNLNQIEGLVHSVIRDKETDTLLITETPIPSPQPKEKSPKEKVESIERSFHLWLVNLPKELLATEASKRKQLLLKELEALNVISKDRDTEVYLKQLMQKIDLKTITDVRLSLSLINYLMHSTASNKLMEGCFKLFEKSLTEFDGLLFHPFLVLISRDVADEKSSYFPGISRLIQSCIKRNRLKDMLTILSLSSKKRLFELNSNFAQMMANVVSYIARRKTALRETELNMFFEPLLDYINLNIQKYPHKHNVNEILSVLSLFTNAKLARQSSLLLLELAKAQLVEDNLFFKHWIIICRQLLASDEWNPQTSIYFQNLLEILSCKYPNFLKNCSEENVTAVLDLIEDVYSHKNSETLYLLMDFLLGELSTKPHTEENFKRFNHFTEARSQRLSANINLDKLTLSPNVFVQSIIQLCGFIQASFSKEELLSATKLPMTKLLWDSKEIAVIQPINQEPIKQPYELDLACSVLQEAIFCQQLDSSVVNQLSFLISAMIPHHYVRNNGTDEFEFSLKKLDVSYESLQGFAISLKRSSYPCFQHLGTHLFVLCSIISPARAVLEWARVLAKRKLSESSESFLLFKEHLKSAQEQGVLNHTSFCRYIKFWKKGPQNDLHEKLVWVSLFEDLKRENFFYHNLIWKFILKEKIDAVHHAFKNPKIKRLINQLIFKNPDNIIEDAFGNYSEILKDSQAVFEFLVEIWKAKKGKPLTSRQLVQLSHCVIHSIKVHNVHYTAETFKQIEAALSWLKENLRLQQLDLEANEIELLTRVFQQIKEQEEATNSRRSFALVETELDEKNYQFLLNLPSQIIDEDGKNRSQLFSKVWSFLTIDYSSDTKHKIFCEDLEKNVPTPEAVAKQLILILGKSKKFKFLIKELYNKYFPRNQMIGFNGAICQSVLALIDHYLKNSQIPSALLEFREAIEKGTIRTDTKPKTIEIIFSEIIDSHYLLTPDERSWLYEEIVRQILNDNELFKNKVNYIFFFHQLVDAEDFTRASTLLLIMLKSALLKNRQQEFFVLAIKLCQKMISSGIFQEAYHVWKTGMAYWPDSFEKVVVFQYEQLLALSENLLQTGQIEVLEWVDPMLSSIKQFAQENSTFRMHHLMDLRQNLLISHVGPIEEKGNSSYTSWMLHLCELIQSIIRPNPICATNSEHYCNQSEKIDLQEIHEKITALMHSYLIGPVNMIEIERVLHYFLPRERIENTNKQLNLDFYKLRQIAYVLKNHNAPYIFKLLGEQLLNISRAYAPERMVVGLIEKLCAQGSVESKLKLFNEFIKDMKERQSFGSEDDDFLIDIKKLIETGETAYDPFSHIYHRSFSKVKYQDHYLLFMWDNFLNSDKKSEHAVTYSRLIRNYLSKDFDSVIQFLYHKKNRSIHTSNELTFIKEILNESKKKNYKLDPELRRILQKYLIFIYQEEKNPREEVFVLFKEASLSLIASLNSVNLHLESQEITLKLVQDYKQFFNDPLNPYELKTIIFNQILSSLKTTPPQPLERVLHFINQLQDSYSDLTKLIPESLHKTVSEIIEKIKESPSAHSLKHQLELGMQTEESQENLLRFNEARLKAEESAQKKKLLAENRNRIKAESTQPYISYIEKILPEQIEMLTQKPFPATILSAMNLIRSPLTKAFLELCALTQLENAKGEVKQKIDFDVAKGTYKIIHSGGFIERPFNLPSSMKEVITFLTANPDLTLLSPDLETLIGYVIPKTLPKIANHTIVSKQLQLPHETFDLLKNLAYQLKQFHTAVAFKLLGEHLLSLWSQCAPERLLADLPNKLNELEPREQKIAHIQMICDRLKAHQLPGSDKENFLIRTKTAIINKETCIQPYELVIKDLLNESYNGYYIPTAWNVLLNSNRNKSASYNQVNLEYMSLDLLEVMDLNLRVSKSFNYPVGISFFKKLTQEISEKKYKITKDQWLIMQESFLDIIKKIPEQDVNRPSAYLLPIVRFLVRELNTFGLDQKGSELILALPAMCFDKCAKECLDQNQIIFEHYFEISKRSLDESEVFLTQATARHPHLFSHSVKEMQPIIHLIIEKLKTEKSIRLNNFTELLNKMIDSKILKPGKSKRKRLKKASGPL